MPVRVEKASITSVIGMSVHYGGEYTKMNIYLLWEICSCSLALTIYSECHELSQPRSKAKLLRLKKKPHNFMKQIFLGTMCAMMYFYIFGI